MLFYRCPFLVLNRRIDFQLGIIDYEATRKCIRKIAYDDVDARTNEEINNSLKQLYALGYHLIF